MGPPGDESAGGPACTPRRTAEGARGHAPRAITHTPHGELMPRTRTRLTLGLALATFALAALVAASASPAPDRSAGRNPKLQRRLDAVVAAGAPGAMLLVRDGDRTVRLTSGNGNLRPKTPMRAGDRFRVGSITKTFVATVVLQLVAERKLTLEDTIARWLPGVVPDGEHITVRQLLNHTSGLF